MQACRAPDHVGIELSQSVGIELHRGFPFFMYICSSCRGASNPMLTTKECNTLSTESLAFVNVVEDIEKSRSDSEYLTLLLSALVLMYPSNPLMMFPPCCVSSRYEPSKA